MAGIPIVDYFWDKMNALHFNTELFKIFDLKTVEHAEKVFKSALKTYPNEKKVNKRITGPKLITIKNDLDKVNSTSNRLICLLIL